MTDVLPASDKRVRGSYATPQRVTVMRAADNAQAPGDRRVMPTDFSISLRGTPAPELRILDPRPAERRQPMPGFEDTFTDVIDFILRVTHLIWEEKSIGYLYESYSSACVVNDDAGLVRGREQVIVNTTQFITAFPDLRILPDEIIWCSDGAGGFWTSHRCTIIGHHTGRSAMAGEPTGRPIAVRCIAICHSVANQIDEEFVLYNTGSLLRQTGADLKALAAARTTEQIDTGEVERVLGLGHPRLPTAAGDGPFDVDAFVRRYLHTMWNWRMLDAADVAVVPNVRLHLPTDREMYGRGALKGWVLGLLSVFPDLAHSVDDLFWMGNPDEGYLVSVRWSILGTHRGDGDYGPPTGRRVVLRGITQYRVDSGRITEEWTVSNEFDVLVQLLGRLT